MFYELLAGMNEWDKQDLYLQGAETYFYLNQVKEKPMNSPFLCDFFLIFLNIPVLNAFLRAGLVSYKGSMTSKTSCSWSTAWRQLVYMQIN